GLVEAVRQGHRFLDHQEAFLIAVLTVAQFAEAQQEVALQPLRTQLRQPLKRRLEALLSTLKVPLCHEQHPEVVLHARQVDLPRCAADSLFRLVESLGLVDQVDGATVIAAPQIAEAQAMVDASKSTQVANVAGCLKRL